MVKLSSRKVDTAATGKYADGDGLYLVVSASGSRKWVFRYMRSGRAREMGLGSASGPSLALARKLATDARLLLMEGKDPLDERDKRQEVPTFGEFAEKTISSLEEGFKNEKHRKQWRSTLRTYAAEIWEIKVDLIGTDHLLNILTPIWTTKHETASRVRGRIEKILDAAKAKGLRSGENPALWRGHLDHLLPKLKKRERRHHTALPYKQVPTFMAALREREGMAVLALEFTILTAARSGEVLGARWSEIDLEGKVWTIPAARMKAGREHRVPLSARAIEILKMLGEHKRGDLVFPGSKPKTQLSVMAMAMVLRRMDVDATVHGFRSCFRDWAGNETSFPRELAEQALAHVIGDKAEQAYRRSDALERRRELMTAWASYLERAATGNVIQLQSRTAH